MIKTFQYRIYPTNAQRKAMDQTIETCRQFYNDCLAEHETAYEERGESIGKYAQLRKVKDLKANNDSAKGIHSQDLITIEDPQITNMVKDHTLARSILDGGWGYFAQRLADKAAKAGRELVRVAPAYTSKTCSGRGAVFEGLSLNDRWVESGCGLSMDRDINAALSILKKAMNRDGQSRWELPWAVAPCVSQEAATL